MGRAGQESSRKKATRTLTADRTSDFASAAPACTMAYVPPHLRNRGASSGGGSNGSGGSGGGGRPRVGGAPQGGGAPRNFASSSAAGSGDLRDRGPRSSGGYQPGMIEAVAPRRASSGRDWSAQRPPGLDGAQTSRADIPGRHPGHPGDGAQTSAGRNSEKSGRPGNNDGERYVSAYQAQADAYQADVLGTAEVQPEGEGGAQSEYAQLVEVCCSEILLPLDWFTCVRLCVPKPVLETSEGGAAEAGFWR
eukprot:SAG31_NODE_764_length_12262_cov_26.578887_13_plen_250_part_00